MKEFAFRTAQNCSKLIFNNKKGAPIVLIDTLIIILYQKFESNIMNYYYYMNLIIFCYMILIVFMKNSLKLLIKILI